MIYELGCRVGELVRIQVKHLNFSRSTVFFPAENTKTKYPRTSYLPKGLMNEIKSLLKQKIVLSKRFENIKKPDAYVFHPGKRWNHRYTENRIRQIFQIYSQKAGLQHSYGDDQKGRELKMFTVHSLRHSHIMHHVVDHGLPLPIVQKQVGHRSLKTTSIYLRPSTEKIAEEYEKVKNKQMFSVYCSGNRILATGRLYRWNQCQDGLRSLEVYEGGLEYQVIGRGGNCGIFEVYYV